MARFRLSCNTVLFAMVGVEEALQHLAWAGYDAAELPYIASMAEHVQPGTDSARRIRSLAGDLGLELCAIEVTPNDAGIYLWIEATNPANYLREIEILMPGGICQGDPFRHALSAQDCGKRRFVSFADDRRIIFYPVFAERLRGYSVLRFSVVPSGSSRIRSWTLPYSTNCDDSPRR